VSSNRNQHPQEDERAPHGVRGEHWRSAPPGPSWRRRLGGCPALPIVLLDRAGQGIYDYLFQAPLLVVLVGLAFTFVIAPGLVEDLEVEEPRDPAA
jgi:hypothetical protein